MRYMPPSETYVTPIPWSGKCLQHQSYGSVTTYRRVAQWVGGCHDVADWGASTGFLRHFLPATVRYLPVDGTLQAPEGWAQMLVDLRTYTQPSEAIVLRHVLDNTFDWQAILTNALAAFQKRMAIVTFTRDAAVTHLAKVKSGWPVWRFNPDDLRRPMGSLLVGEEQVRETHPERIYYLERASCAL